MRFASPQVLWSDVDDVAANGLGRVQGECEVLVDLEDTQLAKHSGLVDGTLINRVGFRLVDELAGNISDSIRQCACLTIA